MDRRLRRTQGWQVQGPGRRGHGEYGGGHRQKAAENRQGGERVDHLVVHEDRGGRFQEDDAAHHRLAQPRDSSATLGSTHAGVRRHLRPARRRLHVGQGHRDRPSQPRRVHRRDVHKRHEGARHREDVGGHRGDLARSRHGHGSLSRGQGDLQAPLHRRRVRRARR